ncbi:GNAT family N-acetyltransferase [Leptolyngbya sp. AN02str]|uniref:GNAT family N-acetyltransferase n=1 Tax=Leptolyngbya sp. AN02str TaxID=3423363 RepID=UPI003D312144
MYFLRPAASTDTDKAAIARICQHTWDGEDDYIMDVWDEWIADPSGCILLLEVDSQPIGMVRLTRLSNSEGWIEGLRVDRTHRQQGWGSVLIDAAMQQAATLGLSTVRTCIHQHNAIMHGFIQRRGYGGLGDYGWYRANCVSQAPSVLQPLQLDDLEMAWAALHRFQPRTESCLFVCRGAKWQRHTQAALAQRLQQGWVWGEVRSRTLHSLFIRSSMDTPDGTFWVGWVGGTPEAMGMALQDIRRLAHQLGFPYAGGFFPQTQPAIDQLSATDYTFQAPNMYRVYEIKVNDPVGRSLH